MAFMEGQREVGILLLTDIMAACPESYVLMMEERNARQSAIDARLSRADGDGSDSRPRSDDGEGDDSADLDSAGDLYTDR
jgi:hypothetical protein